MNYFKCYYEKSFFPTNYYNKNINPVTLLLHDEENKMYVGYSIEVLPKDDNIQELTEKEANELVEKAIIKNINW